jgi:hypothetical protein
MTEKLRDIRDLEECSKSWREGVAGSPSPSTSEVSR